MYPNRYIVRRYIMLFTALHLAAALFLLVVPLEPLQAQICPPVTVTCEAPEEEIEELNATIAYGLGFMLFLGAAAGAYALRKKNV